jgi:hypothetical protein
MERRAPVERLWWPRLRWRMRGAWQWPTFGALTLLDGVLLVELPFTGDGADNLLAGVLLAGFANLFAVAVVGPLAARRLRRRRPDLPKVVAGDYAGTAALVAVAALALLGGVAHRPALTAERDDLAAAVAATHDYVLAQAPGHRAGLASIDVMRIEPELYRACVPGRDPRRWLCVFVSTDQRPAGVTVDLDRAPNSAYRMHGGFR